VNGVKKIMMTSESMGFSSVAVTEAAKNMVKYNQLAEPNP